MKALIFNSGAGRRMGGLTAERPKCLLPLSDGETVLSRQLRILSENGISEAVITTGGASEMIYAEAIGSGMKITAVMNEKYAETNYIYSMYLAEGFIADNDILMLHGDLVFDGRIVSKLMDITGSACITDRSAPLPEKDFKGRIRDGRLCEVSVSIFGSDCFALQPMYRLERSAAMAWSGKVREFVNAGKTDVYAENALNGIAEELDIKEVSYSGIFVSEIDTADDYKNVLNGELFYDRTNSIDRTKRI